MASSQRVSCSHTLALGQFQQVLLESLPWVGRVPIRVDIPPDTFNELIEFGL